jgi:hypothetical protein
LHLWRDNRAAIMRFVRVKLMGGKDDPDAQAPAE